MVFRGLPRACWEFFFWRIFESRHTMAARKLRRGAGRLPHAVSPTERFRRAGDSSVACC